MIFTYICLKLFSLLNTSQLNMPKKKLSTSSVKESEAGAGTSIQAAQKST